MKKALLILIATILTLAYTANIASATSHEHSIFDNEIAETTALEPFEAPDTSIAQKNTDLKLDELKAQITSLQRKLNNRGADFSDELLIVLVIVLSILSLRTEVKFQQLADRYDKLKNTILRNTLIKKIKQKRKTKAN
jgi:hypothetical protein